MSAVKLHFKVSRFVLWTGALSGLAFCLLFVTLYSSKSFPGRIHGLNPHRLPPSFERRPLEPCSPVPADENWEFQAWRDAENYGLSDHQCETAFPKLFVEIDKSVARRGTNITFHDIDSQKQLNGMVRAMVYNGQVCRFFSPVSDKCAHTLQQLLIIHAEGLEGFKSRGHATLHALNRALTSSPNRKLLPNIEFVLLIEDFSGENVPRWVYSKRDVEADNNVWLMPDFGYWSWPETGVSSYTKFRRRAMAIDEGIREDGDRIGRINFQDKRKVLVWRGALRPNPLRQKLYDLAKGKKWADVQYINWDDKEDKKNKLLRMEEYCKYAFLAHVEGRSYSGRMKYLQNCRGVLVSHKLDWIEAHHGALVSGGPEQNYVEIRRDWSNLEDEIMHLIEHPQLAEQIAENSVKTFRDQYLTPAAEACYWRMLIKGWGKVSFEPQFYKDAKKTIWRGVPFESFVLTNMTYA